MDPQKANGGHKYKKLKHSRKSSCSSSSSSSAEENEKVAKPQTKTEVTSGPNDAKIVVTKTTTAEKKIIPAGKANATQIKQI